MKKSYARGFRIERYAFYAFLALYVFVSQVLMPLNNDQEVYPFFEWSLHSTVDNTHRFIQVQLRQLPNGVACLLQNCPNVSPLVKSTRLYFLVQDMGRVQNSDAVAFEEMRLQLEAILKRGGAENLSYQLIQATARPREFAKNGAISLGRVIYGGVVAP